MQCRADAASPLKRHHSALFAVAGAIVGGTTEQGKTECSEEATADARPAGDTGRTAGRSGPKAKDGHRPDAAKVQGAQAGGDDTAAHVSAGDGGGGGGGAAVDPDAAAAVGRPHSRLAHLATTRVVLDGVLSTQQCAELVALFKATSTVGYRPHVRAATIHTIVATAPWALPPLLHARAAMLAAVEEAFDLSLELCVEFTGLVSWCAGASLGWHHDANRDYLSARHLSAVLYLSDAGVDFGAGDFCFQNGAEPLRVTPCPGRMVAYTADARNVHCVEGVSWGERCTLTLWFSLDPAAAEDGKVLEQLLRTETLLAAAAARARPPPLSPMPAPSPHGTHPEALQLLGQHEAGEQSGGACCCGAWLGLPDAMYQEPQEEVGHGKEGVDTATVEAGDLRLLRLRDLGLQPLAADPGGDGASAARCMVSDGEQQQARFASLQDACIAAQFAAWMEGAGRLSVAQLKRNAGALRERVAHGAQQVKAALTNWIALGALQPVDGCVAGPEAANAHARSPL